MVVPAGTADAFEPVFVGLTDVVSLYEVDESADGVSLTWAVEGLFAGPPPRAGDRGPGGAGGARPPGISGAGPGDRRPSRPRDWLTESVASFPPLSAGRFFIHGDHVPGPYPAGKLAPATSMRPRPSAPANMPAPTAACMALDGLGRQRSGTSRPRSGRHAGATRRARYGLRLRHPRARDGAAMACAGAGGGHRSPKRVRVTRRQRRGQWPRGRLVQLRCSATAPGECRSFRRGAPYAVITANILARPSAGDVAQTWRGLPGARRVSDPGRAAPAPGGPRADGLPGSGVAPPAAYPAASLVDPGAAETGTGLGGEL